jgi:hypothetical protein
MADRKSYDGVTVCAPATIPYVSSGAYASFALVTKNFGTGNAP